MIFHLLKISIKLQSSRWQYYSIVIKLYIEHLSVTSGTYRNPPNVFYENWAPNLIHVFSIKQSKLLSPTYIFFGFDLELIGRNVHDLSSKHQKCLS